MLGKRMREDCSVGYLIENKSIKDDSREIYINAEDFPDYNCLICSFLVMDPVECLTCGGLCCEKCVSMWKTTCPNRCKFEVKKPHRLLMNILNNIKIACTNNCGETIKYELFQSHLKNCYSKKYLCLAEGCNFSDKANEIIEHIQTCDFIFKRCEHCNSNISLKAQKSHMKNCAIECNFCKSLIRPGFILHGKEECFMKLIQNLKDEVSENKSIIDQLKTKTQILQATNNNNVRKVVRSLKEKNKNLRLGLELKNEECERIKKLLKKRQPNVKYCYCNGNEELGNLLVCKNTIIF
jgi:hypothetical protein